MFLCVYFLLKCFSLLATSHKTTTKHYKSPKVYKHQLMHAWNVHLLLICFVFLSSVCVVHAGIGFNLFRRSKKGMQLVKNADPAKAILLNNNITTTNNNTSIVIQQSDEEYDSLLPIVPTPLSPSDQTMSVAKALKLSFYFFLWYFFTVVYNVSNKRVLNELPLPATLAAVQILLGIPVFLPAWILKRPSYDAVRSILPSISKIALMHALGNLATVVSLHWGAVSFTHIIKASEPAFSAVLSAMILGSYFPLSVYITLIPIIGGVALASAKELSFTWLGFLSGMASNLFYQLRIVLSKGEFTGEKNTLSPANFFRILTIVSAIELLPISIALEGYKIRSTWRATVESGVDMDTLIANVLISGFSFYCYNEVAFWILDAIHPVTHAVGNTIKRIVIILASIMILKSPISMYGIIGSSIAILGTLAYAIAQYYADRNKNSLIKKVKPSTIPPKQPNIV